MAARLFRATPVSPEPHEIDIDGAAFTAPRIFLNVGGRANVPDMPGVNDIDFLTNTSMLALDTAAEASGGHRRQLYWS